MFWICLDVQEALRCNEPIKVYRQMALNFEQNGKMDEAESLYNIMQKKFKNDKAVWLNACLFYIKSAKLSTARNVFQKALLSLEKRERKLMIIVKLLFHVRLFFFLCLSLYEIEKNSLNWAAELNGSLRLC